MPSSSTALACSASMRSRCWVRATSSRWTVSVSSRRSSWRTATSRRTRVRAWSRSVRSCSAAARWRAAVSRAVAMSVLAYAAPRRTASATVASRLRRSWRAAQPLAGSELVAGRALERVGPTLEGAGTLLLGAQREPQLGLRGAAAAGLELEPVALVGARVLRLGRLGAGLVEALGEPGELDPVALEGRGRRRRWRARCARPRPWRSARWPRGGRAARRRLPSWRRSRAAARGRASTSSLATRWRSCAAVSANRACSPRRVASATRSRVSSTADWISMRLGALAAAAADEAGGEHVAVGGHRGDALTARDEGRCEGGVGDEGHPVEQLLDGGAHGGGRLDDLAGPDGRTLEHGPGGRVARAMRSGRRGRQPGRRRRRAAW